MPQVDWPLSLSSKNRPRHRPAPTPLSADRRSGPGLACTAKRASIRRGHRPVRGVLSAYELADVLAAQAVAGDPEEAHPKQAQARWLRHGGGSNDEGKVTKTDDAHIVAGYRMRTWRQEERPRAEV